MVIAILVRLSLLLNHSNENIEMDFSGKTSMPVRSMRHLLILHVAWELGLRLRSV
jgi:hypothetical protein